MRANLISVLLGAALATAVVVGWYEWRADAPATAKKGQRPRLPAMDAAHPVAGSARPNPRLKTEDPPSRAGKAPADVSEVDALRTERSRLRQQLRDTQARLAEQTATLAHYVGDALSFPDDLDAKYKQDALMTHFSAALQELGLNGEVTDIDCSEYPCIVFGSITGDDKAAFKLSATDALSDYADDMKAMSVWGGQRVVDGKPQPQVTFGVPVLPDGSVDKTELKKRLKLRFHTYWDAAKAAEETDTTAD